MPHENLPGRQFVSEIRLDRRQNPPRFVDVELPTQSVKIFSRKKNGTMLDSSSGVTIMGSIYFSGSYYEDGRGSFALRITRRSVSVGSMAPNCNVWWKLHHSREGTIDGIGFVRMGTLKYRPNIAPTNRIDFGAPNAPLYAFGPGTLTQYFHPYNGTVRVAASLEGYIS